MTNMTRIYDSVEKAHSMGLPAATLFAAQSFAAFPSASWRDVARIELGNGTALEMALRLLPGDDRVLVTLIGNYWHSYVFHRDGGLLHWSYVEEKLARGSVCDAVALTCLLGVALQRPVAVDGACSCEVHS